MEKRKINKTKLNFIIDILLLLVMSAIAGIGFLIKYVLLTGEQKWIKFGANIDQTFLGLDRHGWGYIHLVLGFICIGLLILHIIFHWKPIVSMYRHYFNRLKRKNFIAAIFLVFCLLLIIIPFFVKPKNLDIARGQGHFYRTNQNAVSLENTDRTPLGQRNGGLGRGNTDRMTRTENTAPRNYGSQGQRGGNQERDYSDHSKITEKEALSDEHSAHEMTDTPHDIDHREHQSTGNKSLYIRGYMTLKNVSDKYNVPVSYLKKGLGIRDNESENTRLGILRKQYDFRMSQIEKIITDYQNSR